MKARAKYYVQISAYFNEHMSVSDLQKRVVSQINLDKKSPHHPVWKKSESKIKVNGMPATKSVYEHYFVGHSFTTKAIVVKRLPFVYVITIYNTATTFSASEEEILEGIRFFDIASSPNSSAR